MARKLIRTTSPEEEKAIGQRLRHIRELLKMTSSELSLSLGFSKNYVTQIELCTRIPSLDIILQLYKIHNVNPNFLVLGLKPVFISDKPLKVNDKTSAEMRGIQCINELELAKDIKKMLISRVANN